MKKIIAVLILLLIAAASVSCNRVPGSMTLEYEKAHTVYFNGMGTVLPYLEVQDHRAVFQLATLMEILGATFSKTDVQDTNLTVYLFNGEKYVIDNANKLFLTEEHYKELTETAKAEGKSISSYSEIEYNLLAKSAYLESDPVSFITWTPVAWVDELTLGKMFNRMGYDFTVDYNREAEEGPYYISLTSIGE